MNKFSPNFLLVCFFTWLQTPLGQRPALLKFCTQLSPLYMNKWVNETHSYLPSVRRNRECGKLNSLPILLSGMIYLSGTKGKEKKDGNWISQQKKPLSERVHITAVSVCSILWFPCHSAQNGLEFSEITFSWKLREKIITVNAKRWQSPYNSDLLS